MSSTLRIALLALLALVADSAVARVGRSPVTLLISIDAFRPDYMDRGLTPTLKALAGEGVSAVMRPSFPTKTFPNHYSIVTGLRPDRNGIVANKMLDPARPGETFTTSNDDDPFWWGEAEPLWAAAEQAGIRTASLFWPGSKAGYHGIRPQDWFPWNLNVTSRQRVDTVVDWLRRPAANRPRFISLYFEAVDEAGHHHGIDSPELNAALREIDGAIARLRAGLAALHQPADIIIVSDHGMAPTSPDRVVWLYDIADRADYHVVEEGTVAMIDPVEGHEAALAASLLKPHAHVTCLRKGDLPERLHYGHNPRVTAFICMADLGWLVFDAVPKKWGIDVGSHGYDNQLPDMQAIFIAAGPDIARRGRLPTFDNVDIYALVRDLLRLPPKPDIDGSDAPFKGVLKRR